MHFLHHLLTPLMGSPYCMWSLCGCACNLLSAKWYHFNCLELMGKNRCDLKTSKLKVKAKSKNVLLEEKVVGE